MGTFVIAEAGSSHDNDQAKAFRLIEAAKECGADAVKFQWTSDAEKMAERRGLGIEAACMYEKYLQYDYARLILLKAHADKVGIEFMCTVYLIEDIATIAPLVKRFKVSAFEADWEEFVQAHFKHGKPIIISENIDKPHHYWDHEYKDIDELYCVSKYPTPIDELHLSNVRWPNGKGAFGLSDHTANVLTGAAAVAAGAKIIEAHIRLDDTSKDNPDYPHSLNTSELLSLPCFPQYVRNIRTVERML